MFYCEVLGNLPNTCILVVVEDEAGDEIMRVSFYTLQEAEEDFGDLNIPPMPDGTFCVRSFDEPWESDLVVFNTREITPKEIRGVLKYYYKISPVYFYQRHY